MKGALQVLTSYLFLIFENVWEILMAGRGSYLSTDGTHERGLHETCEMRNGYLNDES